MADKVQVAIIGGGIVGCSIVYWLAKLGCTETLLLERRQLTSGSTWHAAGNATYFGPYPEILRLFTGSIRSYLQAEADSGHSVGFHQTGSLRVAANQHEWQAFERLVPMFEQMNIPYRIVGRDEIAALHPLLSTDGVQAAAHTPTDGHVDSVGTTHALASAARKMGARVWQQCGVERIQPAADGWRLTTAKGDVLAEQVVLAASFWTRELVQPLGLNLPLYALQHHEIITGTAAALAELDFELPTLRDSYASTNTRQEGDGFLCGIYENNPEFWAVEGIPPDFGEELLPPEIDRLEPYLLRVIERIPAFGQAGVKTINNGPLCYTPDACPLLGPVDAQPGLWLASGFNVGIGTGGGSGEFLAHWLVHGQPPFELPIVYPARFSNELARAECLAMIRAAYAKGYALR